MSGSILALAISSRQLRNYYPISIPNILQIHTHSIYKPYNVAKVYFRPCSSSRVNPSDRVVTDQSADILEREKWTEIELCIPVKYKYELNIRKDDLGNILRMEAGSRREKNHVQKKWCQEGGPSCLLNLDLAHGKFENSITNPTSHGLVFISHQSLKHQYCPSSRSLGP